MKLKFFILAVFIIVLGCGGGEKSGKKEKREPGIKETSSKDEGVKTGKQIFDIKAVKIVFNYTGGPETGTETLYFDDFGEVAVLIVDKKSKYSVINQTTIWKDNKSTIIDHEKKTVAKSSFRPKDTEPPSLAGTDEQTRKNIGYEKLPDETIAGKTCEVWFNAKQNFKYCLWNKIGLKEVLGTSINKEATAVEEIAEIPASVKEIPKDYKQ